MRKLLLLTILVSKFVFADSVHVCQGNSCNTRENSLEIPASINTSVETNNTIGITNKSNVTSNFNPINNSSNKFNPISSTTSNFNPVNNTTIKTGSGSDVPNPPDVISVPTAPCRVTYSGSGSGAGFGVGIGGSVMDEGCDARADSLHLHNLGLKKEAILRLCAKPEMAKVIDICSKENN